MNKTYFATTMTMAAVFPLSAAFAFETTAITITCHRGETYTQERECISATRTTDADFGDGGYIVCLCPDDHTKLKKFICSSYYSSVAGITYARWETGECYSCGAGRYNNGGSCSNCPLRSYGATSNDGTVSANQCYFPQNVEQSDDTGTFVFENNCYYEGSTSAPLEDSSKGADWYETESTTTAAT